VLPLRFLQCGRRGGPVRGDTAIAAGLQFGERCLERGAAREDDGSLDQVLELADVPRPAVLLERGHGLGGDRFDPFAHPPRELPGEVTHERGDVAAALAKRWLTIGNTLSR
jgi:hypothetical protein